MIFQDPLLISDVDGQIPAVIWIIMDETRLLKDLSMYVGADSSGHLLQLKKTVGFLISSTVLDIIKQSVCLGLKTDLKHGRAEML